MVSAQRDPDDPSSSTLLRPDGDASEPVDPCEQLGATLLGQSAAAAPGQPPPQGSGPIRFKTVRPHARGGLGQVFLALDCELHREVALKELQPQHDAAEARVRFLREAEITALLEHPGVVPVYGLGQYPDGRPFYAMRFIQGQTLLEAIEAFHTADRLSRDPGERRLALRHLLNQFLGVCNTIAYAHSRGVLHRDLKPANVMLGAYGETLVIDWGLAKRLSHSPHGNPADGGTLSIDHPPSPQGNAECGENVTQLGQVIGTPAYMSPEQARGRVDELCPASDVYSLGATLYHLLTGRPPFCEGDLRTLLENVIQGAFRAPRHANPAVPAVLDAICRTAMALNPGQRYPSARALAGDVEHWLADEPVSVYTEPLRVRANRWARRHRTVVTVLSAIAVVALVALSVGAELLRRENRATTQALSREREARRHHALAQLHALLDARPEVVPSLLDSLAPFRDDVEPELRRLWNAPTEGAPSSRRIHAGLALLRFDPEVARDQIFSWMLEAEEPQEFLLLCRALEPHRDQLMAPLWNRVDGKHQPEERFRALVALMIFGADPDRWQRSGDLVIGQLLSADPLSFPQWMKALHPARQALLVPLASDFRRAAEPERRRLAATVAISYAGDDPATLADLLPDADDRQYMTLWPAVQRQRVPMVSRLEREVLRTVPAMVQAEDRDALARRQAQAAVALLQLGREEPVWQLLRHSRDPSRRTHLVHLLAPLGTDPRPLVRRLRVESDVSARRALLLSLGTFGDRVSAETRRELRPDLVKAYRDDSDPGIHSAIDWLLRRWDGDGELITLDAELARQPPGQRDWFVNRQGQTYAVFRGPCRFRMGSPDPSATRPMTVPRSFALSTREVTVEQFQRFRKDHAYRREYSPGPTGPIIDVNWYEAAAYCNWLSEREGIPKEQWCYPEKVGEGMQLPRDHLSRTGYRLPTEAEWEFACRAGADISRPHCDTRALLDRYAWYVGNTHSEGTRPVGRLLPNDAGLFDILGNTAEWCHSRPGQAGEDREDDELEVRDNQLRVYRGGGFFYRAAHVHSAYSMSNYPTYMNYHVGFRPARTVR